MFFQNTAQMFDRAREVTLNDNGPYERFQNSGRALATLIGQYMDKFGTPEDERNLIIGHYGIMGETNNSINFLLHGLRSELKDQKAQPGETALRGTFLLSTLTRHESQYSHLTHTGENVIAACNRIIDDVGKWTEKHAAELEPFDHLQILCLRDEFARSLDEIYEFICETDTFYKTFDVPVKLPKSYQRLLASRGAAPNSATDAAPANTP